MKIGIIRFIVTIVLSLVMLLTVACDSTQQKAATCGGLALSDVAIAILTSESADVPVIATALATFKACVDAYDAFFTSPTSSSTTTENKFYSADSTEDQAFKTNSTLTVSNCTSDQSLVNDSITIEVSYKVILSMGDQKFSSLPDQSDTNSIDIAARDLAIHDNIPLGTVLTSDATINVTLPSHTQVSVIAPGATVSYKYGSVTIQNQNQQNTSQVQKLLWGYPISIQTSGQPTENGLPIPC